MDGDRLGTIFQPTQDGRDSDCTESLINWTNVTLGSDCSLLVAQVDAQ